MAFKWITAVGLLTAQIASTSDVCQQGKECTGGVALLQKQSTQTQKVQLDEEDLKDDFSIFDPPDWEIEEPDDASVIQGADGDGVSESRSSIDCGEEMVLRLAVSDTFKGQSFGDCMKKTTEKAFKTGGSGEKMMASAGSGGSGMTREQVTQKIRSRCYRVAAAGIALGPRLIRMTFHDAADFNNLMFANGSAAPAGMGRVDSCLHTALLSTGLTQSGNNDTLEELAKGDPNHNRGLRNAERWVMKIAKQLSLSRPDAQVLGAVVAMEAWMDGPELGAVFGRKQGHCTKIVCSSESCWDADTPFFKQPVAEPVGAGMMCPMTNTIEPLRSLLNLTLPEMVALQGAHSVGGVIVCSGLGNVVKGPYCPSTCGTPPKDFLTSGNLDGSVFDDTPGKLDNRYYQLLMNENYEELATCKTAKKQFPYLAQRTLRYFGNATTGGKTEDRTKTCGAGLKYAPENSCQLEVCVEKCSLSNICMEAQNLLDGDQAAYQAAVAKCNACKYMCGTSHRDKHFKNIGPALKNSCKNNCSEIACNASLKPNVPLCYQSCESSQQTCLGNRNLSPDYQGRSDFSKCRDKCKTPFRNCEKACKGKGREARSCKKQCKAQYRSEIGKCNAEFKTYRSCWKEKQMCKGVCRNKKRASNRGCRDCRADCKVRYEELRKSILGFQQNLTIRPARWCKRLPDIKQCLHPNMSVGTNNGWNNCPQKYRVTIPNHGQGRHTIIQNLERWTTWRGLHKRVIVLPSDWSWLGKPETKRLFQHYGTNENDWKVNFGIAWNKISQIGWEGQLATCRKVSCSLSSTSITCPAGSSSIEFPLSNCTPNLSSDSSTSCELVGGYGLKAKLHCGDWSGLCTSAGAAAAEAEIVQEWTQGGKTPQCP